MSLRALIAGGLALFGGTALGPGTSVRTDDVRTTRVAVEVTNDNRLDVDILVLMGDARSRLGSVIAGQTRSFNLPPEALTAGRVRFVADPVGARAAYTSDPVSVTDGQRVRIRVAPQLSQSSIVVEDGS